MKFLVMISPKDIIFTLPPTEVKQIVEAMIDWRNQKKQAGVILEAYSLAGWNRYAMVCQHDSAEDIDKTLRSMPGTGLMNSEAYPLSDWDETARANLEAAKASEKYGPAQVA